MDDMVTIQVFISTSTIGSECTDYIEVERHVWESMTDDEKDYLCREAAFNYLEWGWKEL